MGVNKKLCQNLVNLCCTIQFEKHLKSLFWRDHPISNAFLQYTQLNLWHNCLFVTCTCTWFCIYTSVMSWNPIQRSASLQCTFSECHIFCLIVFDYNFQMITHFFLTNLELVTQSLCQSVTFSGCHIACASLHCGKILLGWWLCFQCLLWWLVVVTRREKQRTKRAKVPCSKYQWTDQCWSRHMQCKKKYQRRASTNNRDYLFTCLWGACVLEKLPNLE